jgi:quinol monooxygenase YgiN
MREPVVFISRNRVKAGKLEQLKRFFREGTEQLKREKPGTVAFLAYVSDDGAEATIVHVFPDADAMDRHMEGVAERTRESSEFIESAGMEVYGQPNDGTIQMFKQIAGSGVPVSFRPHHIGGYLRLTAGT